MTRDELLQFATWLLEGEFGEGREEEIVDKYLEERPVSAFEHDAVQLVADDCADGALIEERWYQEGTPVVEAVAQYLWGLKSIPGKLPWVELGVQGRVGPRREAYQILAIAKERL